MRLPSITPRLLEAGLLTKPRRAILVDYFKSNWLDLSTVLSCLLASFMIYLFANPLMSREFPLYAGIDQTDFWIKHGKHLRREYISTLVSAVVSFGVPASIILLCGILKVRNFQDTHNALMGLLYSLSASSLFQSVLKWTIGGLRPYFMAVCRPPMSLTSEGQILTWYDAQICTGDMKEVREAQMSFPSGHSVAAFAGFGLVALYLNAKFGIFAPRPLNERVPFWQLGMVAFPVLAACVIAGSKVRDGWHHPEDVVAGSLIGSVFAYMAFKSAYPAVRREEKVG
ncbi:unnamed protein product [Periconia digitata]|uniref:Phosphatidic acid phosphatase type 2/haloperoxidase domain-containing protein n=1 Tax=Periconia digitata TaxID=1303443 RepID=A0A9W4XLX3_9PLEO|nr:unnamed protein product [Periconia digitata]